MHPKRIYIAIHREENFVSTFADRSQLARFLKMGRESVRRRFLKYGDYWQTDEYYIYLSRDNTLKSERGVKR